MPPVLAFFGMILFLILGTKGVWVLLAREPKRMRVWCHACGQELEWKQRDAGRSQYGHVDPADHQPIMTTMAPSRTE